MGFFNSFAQLLDENSNKSFEKVIVGAIDKVEDTLNQTLDKAESGVKKIDQAGKKAEYVGRTLEKTAEKMTTIANKPEAEI